MKKGIYTLANDNVYDQLIALLNSIEANYGKDIPVCVIPYDDNIKLVKKEVSKRKNVSLFDDKESIKRWEEFATKIWDCHPAAKTKWREMGIKGVYRLGMHRKFCAFDGIFEKFIFLDADIIVLNSLDYIFDRLELGGLVTSDFQHKDASHVYDINSSRLFKVFSREKIRSEIFCAGFYASKKGLLSEKQKNFIISELSRGDAEIL